ncbi:hypothetical protein [Bacillus toyonensis]|uniref:hypothetical protein n=1 Tax=Bacillus toyonensis TaxID=155322 RepID=UPI002E1F36A6|nr:hypothetical protein [Bacillus toyonensis]
MRGYAFACLMLLLGMVSIMGLLFKGIQEVADSVKQFRMVKDGVVLEYDFEKQDDGKLKVKVQLSNSTDRELTTVVSNTCTSLIEVTAKDKNGNVLDGEGNKFNPGVGCKDIETERKLQKKDTIEYEAIVWPTYTIEENKENKPVIKNKEATGEVEVLIKTPFLEKVEKIKIIKGQLQVKAA